MKIRLLLLAISITLTACSCTGTQFPNDKERGVLSTKMVNLSAAVEIYFEGQPSAPGDDDTTILHQATEHDNRLLAKEFEPYVLKVQYQNPFAVVLLCSKDGKKAIMEDAGCSARIDRQVTTDTPCEFTLHVRKGCQVEGADAVK